jgi:hypothetical protein
LDARESGRSLFSTCCPDFPGAAVFYFIPANYALEWGEMRKP